MHITTPIKPYYKLGIAAAVALLFLFLLLPYPMQALTRVLICWNAFATVYILISWITFFYTPASAIRRVAKNQDSSYIVVSAVLLIATLSIVSAILLFLQGREFWAYNKRLITIIHLSGVAFSWFLNHTLFTIHYAHLYYGDDESHTKEKKGLLFPGGGDPAYLDFAYFSFGIGMTFQVSDVIITSKTIRKVVLLHSLISFGFNTIIVALSVNAIIK